VRVDGKTISQPVRPCWTLAAKRATHGDAPLEQSIDLKRNAPAMSFWTVALGSVRSSSPPPPRWSLSDMVGPEAEALGRRSARQVAARGGSGRLIGGLEGARTADEGCRS
jgi:hypothetical protein